MRELFWRARALAMDAWDRAAWICLHLQMSSEPREFSELHPLLMKPPVSAAERAQERARLKEILPADLSNEEIERRFARYQEELRNHGKSR